MGDQATNERGFVTVRVTVTGEYEIHPSDLCDVYGDQGMTYLEAVSIDRFNVETDPREAVALMDENTIEIRLDIPKGIQHG